MHGIDMRNLRQDVELVYSEALDNSLKRPIREILRNMFRKIRMTHEKSIEEQYAKVKAKLYPAFHVHTQIVESSSYLDFGTVRESINAKLKKMVNGRCHSNEYFAHDPPCMSPSDGVAPSALKFADNCESCLDLLDLILESKNSDHGSLMERIKRYVGLQKQQNELQNSSTMFSWPSSVSLRSDSDLPRCNCIILILEYHVNRTQIISLLRYFQRLHFIYSRYFNIWKKVIEQESGTSQDFRQMLSHLVLPSLPQIVLLLMRTSAPGGKFSQLSHKQIRLATIPESKLIERKDDSMSNQKDTSHTKAALIRARKRVFDIPQIRNVEFDACSGSQFVLDSFITCLQPLFTVIPGPPTQGEAKCICTCFFCLAQPNRTIDSTYSYPKLDVCYKSFFHRFFKSWIEKHSQLVPSRNLRLQIEFCSTVKSEGLCFFKNMFLTAVLHHISVHFDQGRQQQKNGDQSYPEMAKIRM